MKKILLSFLILGIVSISSIGFSAPQEYSFGYPYSDPFDESNWTAMYGSWESALPPAPFFYTGYPGSPADVAANRVGILPDLVSAGMNLNAQFSSENGNNAGVFFGAGEAIGPSSSFSNWFAVGISIDDSNFIYLNTDFLGVKEQALVDDSILYQGGLLRLEVFVDPIEHYLFWNVSQQNLDAGGYVTVGFGNLLGLSASSGGVGLFAENDAAQFEAFSVYGDDGSPVPVPAAIWLFASGLLGLVGLKRRQK